MTDQKIKVKAIQAVQNKNIKSMIYNGLVKKNPILVSGMVIAPMVVYSNTFKNALTLAFAFSIITYFTLIISSFVPKSIVYTIRIILYTLIGALVYVPTVIILNNFIPDEITRMGFYFPLLITNSLIVTRSETIFFLESKSKMLIDIIFCILGYDIIVLLFGIIREILSTGELGGKILPVPFVFSGLQMTYGGFLLLGIFAALFRVILLFINKVNS